MDNGSSGLSNRILIVIFIIIVSIVMTYFITKSITEKQVQGALSKIMTASFKQCEDLCGLKKPAFTDFDGTSMNCICLEFANYGNSTEGIIQG